MPNTASPVDGDIEKIAAVGLCLRNNRVFTPIELRIQNHELALIVIFWCRFDSLKNAGLRRAERVSKKKSKT